MKLSGKDGVKWLLTGYGLSKVSPKKALEVAQKKSFPGVVHRRFSNDDYYRLSTEDSGFDFYFSLIDWALSKSLSDVQYIEEYESGKYISAVVREGKPYLMVTATTATLEIQGGISVFYSVIEDAPQILSEAGEKISPLTLELEPSSLNQFIPIALFKSKVGSRHKKPLLAIFAVSLFGVGWLLWPSEESNVIRDTVDPWAGYEEYVSSSASSVYYRFFQDALFQKALSKSPAMSGWQIGKVDHNQNSVTFHLKPREKSATKTEQTAYIRDIKRFISSKNVQSLGQSALRVTDKSVAITLSADVRRLKYHANNTIPSDAMEAFHLLRDAIEKYVPNASLSYESNRPKSGGKWNTHTAILLLEGAYLEDFVGVGSLMRDLPVSFGIEGQEAGGTYDVVYKDEAPRLSGRFVVTVFGE